MAGRELPVGGCLKELGWANAAGGSERALKPEHSDAWNMEPLIHSRPVGAGIIYSLARPAASFEAHLQPVHGHAPTHKSGEGLVITEGGEGAERCEATPRRSQPANRLRHRQRRHRRHQVPRGAWLGRGRGGSSRPGQGAQHCRRTSRGRAGGRRRGGARCSRAPAALALCARARRRSPLAPTAAQPQACGATRGSPAHLEVAQDALGQRLLEGLQLLLVGGQAVLAGLRGRGRRGAGQRRALAWQAGARQQGVRVRRVKPPAGAGRVGQGAAAERWRCRQRGTCWRQRQQAWRGGLSGQAHARAAGAVLPSRQARLPGTA